MANRCPACDARIPWWVPFRLIRLFSVHCPGCRRRLAMPAQTRTYIALMAVLLLLSAACIPFVDQQRTVEVICAGLIGVVVWLVVSAPVTVVSEDEDPRKETP